MTHPLFLVAMFQQERVCLRRELSVCLHLLYPFHEIIINASTLIQLYLALTTATACGYLCGHTSSTSMDTKRSMELFCTPSGTPWDRTFYGSSLDCTYNLYDHYARHQGEESSWGRTNS